MAEPQPTGTLAFLQQYLSDEPTNMEVLMLRVSEIKTAIGIIANDVNAKLKRSPNGMLSTAEEDEATSQMNALNRELERLLKIYQKMRN